MDTFYISMGTGAGYQNPCNNPGEEMSALYKALPVTFSQASLRITSFPMDWNSKHRFLLFLLFLFISPKHTDIIRWF
jgi:hypothetical protein